MRFSSYSIIALCIITLTSCGDDPKLVEKREKQKAEITRLKGEIALIEEKLKSLPADVSSDFAQAKQTAEKQNAEVERLESEVASLDAKKRSLQKEYDAYRIKYQVK
jgi:chromosome segregation ATPase